MLSQEQLQILKQHQQKEILSKREERYHYYGLLTEYQLHPPSIVNSLSYAKTKSVSTFFV